MAAWPMLAALFGGGQCRRAPLTGRRLCCLVLCLLFAPACLALEGMVVRVHDGDTLTLLSHDKRMHKIRLAQIDAPELGQAYGQRARQALARLAFNKRVRVDTETTDRYKRTVGTVVANGLDINRELVRQGMAWVYRRYLRDPSLLQVEDGARRRRAGLWADPNPTPPWEFGRRGQKRQTARQPAQLRASAPAWR